MREKIVWNDKARALALEHHEATHYSTVNKPDRPRVICAILGTLYEAEEDPAKKDELLECIYHAEYMAKELDLTGYLWPRGEMDVSERVKEMRRALRRG